MLYCIMTGANERGDYGYFDVSGKLTNVVEAGWGGGRDMETKRVTRFFHCSLDQIEELEAENARLKEQIKEPMPSELFESCERLHGVIWHKKGEYCPLCMEIENQAGESI